MNKEPLKKRPVLTAVLFAFSLIAFDQIIKAWVIAHIPLGSGIDIIKHLMLYHTRNNGIAFSMLSSFNDWALIVFTLLVIGFVIAMWWISAGTRKYPAHIGYLFILGGAFGNLIDRLRFHYVTDYILFYIGDWSFAVFNLADVFITLGAASIMGYEIISPLQNNRKKNI